MSDIQRYLSKLGFVYDNMDGGYLSGVTIIVDKLNDYIKAIEELKATIHDQGAEIAAMHSVIDDKTKTEHKLKAENARLKQGWISVDDMDNVVDVGDGGLGHFLSADGTDTVREMVYLGKGFAYLSANPKVFFKLISWQPLPQPPTSED